jgi:hypothetical protein
VPVERHALVLRVVDQQRQLAAAGGGACRSTIGSDAAAATLLRTSPERRSRGAAAVEGPDVHPAVTAARTACSLVDAAAVAGACTIARAGAEAIGSNATART